MSEALDQTSQMPATESTQTADLGAAMRSFVEGKESPTIAKPEHVPEVPPTKVTDLDAMLAKSEYGEPEPEAETEVSTETNVESSEESTESAESDINVPEIELKVKGKGVTKVKLDPNDENLKQTLNKGLRFEQLTQQMAEQRKQLESQISKLNDYEGKAEIADRVESAKQLMEQGFKEHALSAILGENTEDFINDLIEERIQYQNASPEERLRMDIEKQKRNEQLARQKDADRIAKLEAQINARSEEVREAEFSGYIEDAKGRYDLSQWVDDSDMADSLNDMLHSAAMSDIIKLQRQREARGEANISQRDIRRAYATRAKQLIKHSERQSSKLADQKVSEQSAVAAANAKVASTKNYGQSDVVSEWKKSGGRMSDLVDMFRGKGGLL